jgi:hypothetical protein
MQKPPLFRKVNTTARGVHHRFGGDFGKSRHTKMIQNSEIQQLGMHGKTRRGRDYTPLFKFLISKIGENWNRVHAEAASRLDCTAPIFWLVALSSEQEQDFVRTGDASYFSGLRIDQQGNLALVNPLVGPSTLYPFCSCCTHTFNGIRFTKRYDESLSPRATGVRLA